MPHTQKSKGLRSGELEALGLFQQSLDSSRPTIPECNVQCVKERHPTGIQSHRVVLCCSRLQAKVAIHRNNSLH